MKLSLSLSMGKHSVAKKFAYVFVKIFQPTFRSADSLKLVVTFLRFSGYISFFPLFQYPLMYNIKQFRQQTLLDSTCVREVRLKI